ncbi:MAG: HAD family phosphatase [Alkalinema sp. RU_4_3]|nr:HAD family phosphatase [Alkalinema sp. RU_4_3]
MPTNATIRLLVLDIDGTIAGSSNTVNAGVIQAIQTAQTQGVQVALATGRMYRSALRFHKTVGSQLPLITYQGAWIQSPQAPTPLKQWALDPELALHLVDYFEHPDRADAISIHLYHNDDLYVRAIHPETQSYADRSEVTPVLVEDLRGVLQNAPTKLLALSKDTDLIDRCLIELKSRFAAHEMYLTTSVATFLEATHPQVNKGAAVKYLAEEVLGLSADQVMAVGDNFNDVEMLAYAGIGVAMGNAPDGVKATANWVAPTVDQDGVAARSPNSSQKPRSSLRQTGVFKPI